jgi:hypothetical protein
MIIARSNQVNTNASSTSHTTRTVLSRTRKLRCSTSSILLVLLLLLLLLLPSTENRFQCVYVVNTIHMTTPKSTALLGGESGPRRQQQDDPEISAANAEARRLAIQLGVATPCDSSLPSSSSWLPIPQPSRMEDSSVSMSAYVPPMSPTGMLSLGSLQSDDPSIMPPAFDSHGQKAPYYEGPYYIKFDQSGKMIKKRWCTSCYGVVSCCGVVSRPFLSPIPKS